MPAEGERRGGGRSRREAVAFCASAACKVLVAGALLAACAPGTQDRIAREAARNAVRPILADRFPGLPLEPLTDCVIDNASSSELAGLARTQVTGLTLDAINTITGIATRPDTVQCLSARAPAVLAQTRRP